MATFKRDIAALQDQQFDVVIVGGGISGAWLAYHAACSGYRTALVEQQDFASQTSSSSSKLLHGGIRYLQQFQFGKVRESAIERAHYIYAAPHLSVPVPFLVPTYKDFARSKFFLNCGMLAYRFLTLGENRIIAAQEEQLPPISSLNKAQLQDVLDLGSEPHTGAVQFYERHMVNSERMVLTILQSAAAKGACVVNHCSAVRTLRNKNTVTGLLARDETNGNEFEIHARLVINAAGPWIDELDQQTSDNAPRINGFAIGSHIITKQICSRAIALTTQHQSNAKVDRGGRHVFVIPWFGYSLIGTSYDEIDQPTRNPKIEAGHVSQLLDAVNAALPTAQLKGSDVISGYSGLYPLRTEEIKSSVYQGSGEYVIIDHAAADNIDGLITALGAKFTTGRKLSALTMQQVANKLGGKPALGKARLDSGQYQSFKQFQRAQTEQHGSLLRPTTLRHLTHLYGSQIHSLVELVQQDPSLGQAMSSDQPDILAQAVLAVRDEQALTLEDVLFRRTSVGFFNMSHDEIATVAKYVAAELGWSAQETHSQVEQLVARTQSLRQTLDSVGSR